MPWKCPACGTPIRQQLTAAGRDEPAPSEIYRCSVCRLELVLDEQHPDTMMPAPLRFERQLPKHRRDV